MKSHRRHSASVFAFVVALLAVWVPGSGVWEDAGHFSSWPFLEPGQYGCERVNSA